jgi:protein-tyrosine phosphatase
MTDNNVTDKNTASNTTLPNNTAPNNTAPNNTASWEHDDLVHGYWIIPGRLLATEYPGHKTAEKARRKLAVLADAGVTSMVDLTEAGERTWDGTPMVPYERLLQPGIAYRRFPIRDTSVIDDDGYDEILAHIRAELEQGRVVLAHCWGGKGRTGTVVGCWLIDTEGLGYPEVIDRMQELRAGTRKADHPVPDTEEQHRVLRRRAERAESTR